MNTGRPVLRPCCSACCYRFKSMKPLKRVYHQLHFPVEDLGDGKKTHRCSRCARGLVPALLWLCSLAPRHGPSLAAGGLGGGDDEVPDSLGSCDDTVKPRRQLGRPASISRGCANTGPQAGVLKAAETHCRTVWRPGVQARGVGRARLGAAGRLVCLAFSLWACRGPPPPVYKDASHLR